MSASLDLFYTAAAGNTVTLEAVSGGMVVASDAFELLSAGSPNTYLHHAFAVSGVEFDFIRLVGSGPTLDGSYFAQVDNVRIDVPSGGAFGLMGVVGVACARRRRR
jgi:MYXO-CTERM domain-containing protein